MELSGNGSAFGPSSAVQALSEIGVLELLEQDSRPTFILDLANDGQLVDKEVQPVFYNASLRSSTRLRDIILGKADLDMGFGLHESGTHPEFREWALHFNKHDSLTDGSPLSFFYSGMDWTWLTLRKRWKVISGNQVKQIGRGTPIVNGITSLNTVPLVASRSRDYPIQTAPKFAQIPQPLLKPADWTELLPSSQHIEFFKTVDWSATALGSLETWSYLLRQMTVFMMSDPRPASMFWGPKKVILYNEPYIMVASGKHPAMMGSTYEQAWPEVNHLSIFIAEVTGQSTTSENTCFFIERHGYLEEAFLSWSMIPIREENGHIKGFYNPVFETTRQTILDRRTKTLISIATAPDLQTFWHDVLRGLEPNHLDVPFALLYSLSNESEPTRATEASMLNLQGSLGVPSCHVCAPDKADFENSDEGFIPHFRKAVRSGEPLVIRKDDGDLPESLTSGLTWRGYGKPSMAVILPLSAGNKVSGFLLVGLNPRRAYDNDYQRFIQLLSRQLSTSMSSAVLMEQAALSQEKLSKQLAIRTREAEESQERFSRIADLMPIGISSTNIEGKLLFANNAFFDITQHPRELNVPMSWMGVIIDEDLPLFSGLWETLMVKQQPVDCHLRLKKTFQAPKNIKGEVEEYYTTVLVNAYPEIDDDGATRGVTSTLTDISQIKHLEEVQKRRAEEALERATLSEQLARRTQEAAESESKFKAMAELTPVGMYYISPAGKVIYANDTFYEITGHMKGLHSDLSFMEAVLEEDQPLMKAEWATLNSTQAPRTYEIRLKKRWHDKNSGKSTPTWILVSASQQRNDDGSLISVMGCLIDISIQKQAQEDALERAVLSEQLIIRTQEAAESEKKFKRMAELAPCGMFYITPEGLVMWANSQWYEMTGHGRMPEDHYPMSFLNFILDEDHEILYQKWDDLTIKKVEATFEIRIKRRWINHASGKPTEETAWLLAMAFPEKGIDGSVHSIMGCTADISQLKWVESVQMRSRMDAEEAKRQQEQFMDITSHEMRNPLTAILQCADGITTSLNNYISTADKALALSDELIHSTLDAAQIITLCSQHQTRIINDVLTLSKLNSDLLLVTPVAVQPTAVVQGILKMFKGELQSHDIRMHFLLEPTYKECKVDLVFCDPSRLTQVFINLLTNVKRVSNPCVAVSNVSQAIKFTRSERERRITVSLAASAIKPPKGLEERVEWFPTEAADAKKDPTNGPDWGHGEDVYLYFAVRDTGKGLSAEEKTRLFHRFSQASPRTHVQYGGSGLGLFISRKLTELQGGEIGVASEAGEGSTFAFYIKGKRAASAEASIKRKNSATKSDYLMSLKDQEMNLSKANDQPPRVPTGKESRTPGMSKNYTVLLVEDNLVNQRVLGKQLQRAGCTVHVANHGQEAIGFLENSKLCAGSKSENDVDIVLMDLEMPVMDGLTCARKVRQLQNDGLILRHVPIIAVTANARMEQIDTALAAGMDDVMPKPFQISDLLPKMDKLMAKQ
ncbi:MAG: hypothetical protein M1827_007170 [Pycnora praestabilis]|nr:MAG: hypothetical protein M1827_007170 [Pycnora praestabilis]